MIQNDIQKAKVMTHPFPNPRLSPTPDTLDSGCLVLSPSFTMFSHINFKVCSKLHIL